MKEINDGKNATSIMTASTVDASVDMNKMDNLIAKKEMGKTPLDTISRHVAKKTLSSSPEVEYHWHESASFTTTISKAASRQTSGTTATIIVEDATIFSESDTIKVSGVKGYNDDGITLSDKDLVLYYIGLDTRGNPIVMATNGHGEAKSYLPAIPKDTKLVRMGKACGETTRTAPVYAVSQTTDINYCQKFIVKISSPLDKISDIDMSIILGRKSDWERTLLFGAKGKFNHPKTKEIVTSCKGIYYMTKKEIKIGKYDEVTKNSIVTTKDLNHASSEIYLGINSGSKKKILLAGNKLVSAILKALPDNNVVEKYGLRFNRWQSSYGETLVIYDEAFDSSDMSDCGFVLDPDYLNKAILNTPENMHHTEETSEGITFQESSCLYLTHPQSHAQIQLAKE